ncbi:MAG: hypothetical protein JSW61_14205 [Candidatus Thorarchaeota archaeon]|nr:MAG: hypothetical protein JSW61_14205 [Candidatus Thorarchaeota archaeon]
MEENAERATWPDSGDDVGTLSQKQDKLLISIGFIGSLFYAMERFPVILLIVYWQGPISPVYYSIVYFADYLSVGAAIMIGLGLLTLAQTAQKNWATAVPIVMILLPITTVTLSRELMLLVGEIELYQLVSAVVVNSVWLIVAAVIWSLSPSLQDESRTKLTSLIVLLHVVGIPISTAVAIPFVGDISQIWIALLPAAVLALIAGVALALFFKANLPKT